MRDEDTLPELETPAPLSCQNCQSTHLDTLYQAPAFEPHIDDTFIIARCLECGIVNSPSVTKACLDEAYSAEYYGDETSKFSTLLERLLAFAAKRQAKTLIKRWQAGRSEAPKVLDIGCGRGVLLQAFQGFGARVSGIERETFPGRPDFVHIGSLADKQFEAQQFDIIVIWHVLEHLTHVDELLTQIRSHISPDGLLVIAVPNFGSWQQRTFSRHWFHLDQPRHLIHFEEVWLKDRLTKHGFEQTQVSHFDLIQGPYGFIQSAMNVLFPDASNGFYTRLKQRGGIGLPVIGWGLVATLLAPFALLETLISSVTGQGATFVMNAKPKQP